MGQNIGSKVCANVLILGLGNAGKTLTCLRFLSLITGNSFDPSIEIPPTVGSNVSEELEYQGVRLIFHDIGGQQSIRGTYQSYDSQAIIFVIDGSHPPSWASAKKHFNRVRATLSSDGSRTVSPILFLINKSDLPECASYETILETFEISSVCKFPINIIRTSALSGEGLQNGLDWLVTTIKKLV